MSRLMNFTLAIILAGIVALGILFAPGWDPVMFWGSIAWVMLLVFINWLTSAIVLGGSSTRFDGAPGNPVGSLPGISLVAFVYSIASVVVLMCYHGNLIQSRTHLAFQIVFLVISAVLVLLALVAAKGAAYGANSPVTQAQLVDGLQRMQRMTEDSVVHGLIQDQINYVRYRLPHPSKLNGGALIQAFKSTEITDPENLENALEEFKRHLLKA